MKYLLSQIWSGNMPWCKFAFAHLWSEAHFLTTVAFMSAGHFIAKCYLMHREVHFIAPSKKSIAFAMLFLLGAEEGIWTLAPVTRPTPLAGEPLHHLGTSANILLKNKPDKYSFVRFVLWRRGWDSNPCAFWANGFQDRLVMTTSIPLRVFVPKHIITLRVVCQLFFCIFWKKLFIQ